MRDAGVLLESNFGVAGEEFRFCAAVIGEVPAGCDTGPDVEPSVWLIPGKTIAPSL